MPSLLNPLAQLLEEGQVWLQPANVALTLSVSSKLTLFRALANPSVVA
jgi:hypothetical protein